MSFRLIRRSGVMPVLGHNIKCQLLLRNLSTGPNAVKPIKKVLVANRGMFIAPFLFIFVLFV